METRTETMKIVSDMQLKWKRIPDQIGLKAYDPTTNTTYETFKYYDAVGSVLLVNGESVGVYYYQWECKEEAERLNLENHRKMFPSIFYEANKKYQSA